VSSLVLEQLENSTASCGLDISSETHIALLKVVLSFVNEVSSRWSATVVVNLQNHFCTRYNKEWRLGKACNVSSALFDTTTDFHVPLDIKEIGGGLQAIVSDSIDITMAWQVRWNGSNRALKATNSLL
jgi:hypothetical protein